MTKETGMFCLNTTRTRQDEGDEKKETCAVALMNESLPIAAVITKVENFSLTDKQAMKIKAIHERAVAEVMEALGW